MPVAKTYCIKYVIIAFDKLTPPSFFLIGRSSASQRLSFSTQSQRGNKPQTKRATAAQRSAQVKRQREKASFSQCPNAVESPLGRFCCTQTHSRALVCQLNDERRLCRRYPPMTTGILRIWRRPTTTMPKRSARATRLYSEHGNCPVVWCGVQLFCIILLRLSCNMIVPVWMPRMPEGGGRRMDGYRSLRLYVPACVFMHNITQSVYRADNV